MALTATHRALIRIANVMGRDALESIILGRFPIIQAGGLRMTSGSVNGKAFSYTFPPGTSDESALGTVEEALEWFDGSTPEQITAMLTTRPINFTIPTFGGCY